MKRLHLIRVFALLAAGQTGCIDFRHDVDGNRNISIQRTAPQAEAETGARSKFAVMIQDSKGDPKSLHVYARVDSGKRLSCTLDPTPTNNIDETVDETIFRCPIAATRIAGGAHSVRYWVNNRDGVTAAERSVGFTHDVEPPLLQVHATAGSNGTVLTWDAGDPREFNELTVSLNGVRIFTSFASAGSALLDASVAKSASQLEVRAYDEQRNSALQAVTVP